MPEKEHSRLRTIRLKNLAAELNRRKEKGETNIHTKLGMSSSRLSQLSRGHTGITDKVARKIEKALHLEHYSLDSQYVRAYIFLTLSEFKYQQKEEEKTDLTETILTINSNWPESQKPIIRLDYILGEWDAMLEVRCQYLEQIKEIVGQIHQDTSVAVAKSTTYISFGETERFE